MEELYLTNSLIPARYKNTIPLQPAVADEQVFRELQEVRRDIRQFVKEGKNLLICSNFTGNGKTTWAIKLLKAYVESVASLGFKNNCPALFINISNFLNKKKLAIGNPEIQAEVNDIESKILTAKLVVFDDLGVKDLSEYDSMNLYYWIDERTNNLLSSIYTSNLLPDQLKQLLDSRVYSRVVNYSDIKIIKDGDHRTSI